MSQEKSAERLDHSAIHLLHKVWQCTGNAFQREADDADVTPRQYVVLAALADNQGLSQTRLVERTGIDRSTMTDLMRRMVKKGLLERRRQSKDARAYAVKLTAEGRRRLRMVQPIVARVDQRILKSLQAPNRERFVRDLKMIIDALSM